MECNFLNLMVNCEVLYGMQPIKRKMIKERNAKLSDLNK